MKKKVLQTIKKYNLINENDKIVIGVSGGPDSMCLLHLLNDLKNELKIEIVVAHINHMIRKQADEETKYVQDYCKKIGVDCYIKKIDVIKKSNEEKIGTEEAGRKARYDFFEGVLKQTTSNKIATAHNANDNAETVLMNIFRGTGIFGLKGIEPIRNEKFIRPIIECQRNEIEEYCEIHNLQPKIDQSNFENIYTRNKIRNIIIPEIKEKFNPNIIEAINKLSFLAKQENEFVQKYVNDIIEKELLINENSFEENSIIKNKIKHQNNSDVILKIVENNNIKKLNMMNLKKFNKLDEFIKTQVILNMIQRTIGNLQGIEKIHIDDIIIMCSKNIGNKYLTPNKNIKIFVKAGVVYFMKIS